MSCIGITLRRADTPIRAKTRRATAPMVFTGLRYDLPAEIAVERKTSPIEFRCGIVCSIEDKFYLKIPQEHIWLIPENDFSEDVVVYANVTWRIETE